MESYLISIAGNIAAGKSTLTSLFTWRAMSTRSRTASSGATGAGAGRRGHHPHGPGNPQTVWM